MTPITVSLDLHVEQIIDVQVTEQVPARELLEKLHAAFHRSIDVPAKAWIDRGNWMHGTEAQDDVFEEVFVVRRVAGREADIEFGFNAAYAAFPEK